MPDPVTGDPYAGTGVERVALSGTPGEPVAVITPSERNGSPIADLVWVPPGVQAPSAAGALLDTFAGARVSLEDAAVVAALRAWGAVQARHTHAYTWDLRADPPPTSWAAQPGAPPRVHLDSLDETLADDDATALARCLLAAFPPGHPDAQDRDVETAERVVRTMARGEVLGPLLPGATLARREGSAVGALFLTDRGGVPPYGGAWVTDLYRAPGQGLAGLGAAMLRRALAVSALGGLTGVGLAVSDANPARVVYERLGFRHVQESWTLQLPSPVPSARVSLDR